MDAHLKLYSTDICGDVHMKWKNERKHERKEKEIKRKET
jgi:hypothetical protein